jgi:hypothetical protein
MYLMAGPRTQHLDRPKTVPGLNPRAEETQMMVRSPAVRGSVGIGSRKKASRNGVLLFVFVTLGAGAAAGFVALATTTLSIGLQTLAADFAPYDYTAWPIEAGTLFPPVPAVHKVVNVYDPPPARPSWPAQSHSGSQGGVPASDDGATDDSAPSVGDS